VSPALLGGPPLVHPGSAHRDTHEGLEAPLVEWRVPWLEARVHRADERRGERPGDVRSTVVRA
jgi:hypothetical protein